jgi:ADP-heptose:LPS heptosyltransferase
MREPALHIIASGGIGDTILVTPCIRQWKRNFPNGRLIVHCADALLKDVLLHNPHIDSLRLMRADRDSVPSYRSRRGRGDRYFTPITYSNLYPSISYKVSASHIFAEMLGISLEDAKPEIYVTSTEISLARTRLSDFPTPIVIHTTGSSSENKNWLNDRWEAVVRSFPACTFIQLGSLHEALIDGVVDYRGLKLRESMAILQACRAFVGVDSAMSHAAAAFRVPSVVLFGPSTPDVWGHPDAINLYARIRCSPCIDILRFGTCPYSRECMRTITSASVERALRFHLDRKKTPATEYLRADAPI